MRHLALIAAFVAPSAALAGPDRVAILLGSEHVNATIDFQEFNPGVFLIWEGKYDFGVGVFYNSYEDVSVSVSTAYNFIKNEQFNFGVFGALAVYPGEGDRFDHSIGDIIPIVGLQARYGNVFTQLIPGGGQSTDAVLTFGLTFSLD